MIFTPYTTIWVWMQANVTSGSVVTGVYGKPAQITFGGSTTEVTLQYSQSAGGFVAGSSAKALKGAAATADAALGGATVKLLDFSKYAR